MENLQDNNLETEVETRSKKVERSAAYPSISIPTALDFVAEIYKNFRSVFAKRDDILNLIEGSQIRFIAAGSYYRFLNREKDTYQVSELYKAIVQFTSEKEKKTALLEAFQSPKLYKELIEKFDGDQLPKELVAHLSRFHKITFDAAPIAADIFIKNAKYCGILDDNNVLNFKKKLSVIEVSDGHLNEETREIKKEEATHNNTEKSLTTGEGEVKTPPLQTNDIEKKQILLEEMVNEERVKIRLTGRKFAYLIYPADTITKTDVAILQKEIEKLQLMVE
ncbi:MAG TPA: hypothetical protein VF700_00530 [Segetibacter sp.]